ncbi:hypothetical protein CAPTEDRAFT_194248 [Capitella teleta]|uniref:Uncharacterized protein n=1 Tax=Capitella teleta TaxID=283909 RepID=R7TL05_CAPTE|nr:hypothetical protein CAPTEDRAFT_194248 [Capitella teleta]|eukprot:ELT92241.1 hypothetical protein CAPTEDRAFT_194248 [Capitella teleta]
MSPANQDLIHGQVLYQYCWHSRKAKVPATSFEMGATKDFFRLMQQQLAQQTQQNPPIGINKLALEKMQKFMQDQFHPRRFVVREHFKFWSKMQCKPGEAAHQLASRICQNAMTCNFDSIKKPQDEAMRMHFICSINNEAALKAVFKLKDEDLTFSRAIEARCIPPLRVTLLEALQTSTKHENRQ